METTTLTIATDLRVGDTIRLYGGGLRKITGIDVTPAAVRVRAGRSTIWSRSKHDALWPVVTR